MNPLHEDIKRPDRSFIPAKPSTASQPLLILQLLRGVAALLVVAYHLSLFFENHFKQTNSISRFFGHGYAGVDLFFVISGFVITYATFPADKKSPSLPDYWRKRFIRVFPIYWLLLLTFWVACRLSYGGLPPVERHQFDWVSAFFLLPGHQPIIPVSWSLSHELYFYALISLLLYSRRLWFIIALVVGGTLYHVLVSQPFTPIFGFLFNAYNLEFLGGVVACLLYRAGPFRPSVYWSILLASGVWLAAGPATTDGNQAGRFVLYGLASIGLIIALTGLEANRQIGFSTIFTKLGDASYIIYLLHPSALAFVYKFVENRPAFPVWAFVGVSIALPIAVAIISIVIHEFLEKPLLRKLNDYFKATDKRGIPTQSV